MEPFLMSATTENFDTMLQSSPKSVVVDFWASWCQPCLRVSPILDGLAQERSETVNVVKVNVDEEPELAHRYGVQSIPTLIRFDGGKETHRVIGALPKPTLLERLGFQS